MTKSPTPPLTTLSSFVVLLLDWTLFAFIVQAPNAAALATLVAVGSTTLAVSLCERRTAENRFAPRWMRALGAGIAVAIPLPMYGTLLALTCVAWSLLAAPRALAAARTQRG